MPPTILIGFEDGDRFLFNDEKNGLLKVKTGYISPKKVSNFINKYMTREDENQKIKD